MRFFFSILTSLYTIFVGGQDISRARATIDTLTSPTFWGRGYTNNGMAKAAEFLEAEFKRTGLQAVGSAYRQGFTYPANTFPGKMEVAINDKTLRPGLDFIISPESKGINGKSIPLHKKDSITYVSIDNKIEVVLKSKLTWSVLNEVAPYTKIEVDKKALPSAPEKITLHIENKFVSKFKASNVVGLVPGTAVPDSLLIITAHYDHLGGMGAQTYFPGANDNASGVAMLLELAQHFAANPLRYSVVFIAFGGEEAGLRGSEYFVQNPLFPLNKVRFLTNVDLTGTGDDGIAVVNATLFKPEFAIISNLNEKEKLFFRIKARGKAANSDHYWFSERGVPAFFIYAMGGVQAYHDVHDKASTLPLTEFQDLFRLIIIFNATISGSSRK